MFFTRKNIDNRYKLGTWAFLGTGWWVSHLAATAAIGYAGYKLAKNKGEENDF